MNTIFDILSNLAGADTENLKQISGILEQGLQLVQAFSKTVEQLAPLAQQIAPMTGPYAPGVLAGSTAALAIATATDKAIDAHRSGQDPALSLAGIAEAVAGSGLLNKDTAGKVLAITQAVPRAET